MSYFSEKTYGHELGLSACFRQWRAKHSHCRFLHGYALSFRLLFTAEELDDRNWVVDFGGLKPVKQFLQDTFDHKLAVAQDDPAIDEICALAGVDAADPIVLPAVGCEQFSKYVYDWVANWLNTNYEPGCYIDRGVRLVEVECREHGANSATYRPEEA